MTMTPKTREELARAIATGIWSAKDAEIYFDGNRRDIRFAQSMSAADALAPIIERLVAERVAGAVAAETERCVGIVGEACDIIKEAIRSATR